MPNRELILEMNSEQVNLARTGVSDASDAATIVVVGDITPPNPPVINSITSIIGGIILSITNPSLNADGEPCTDQRYLRIYRSDAPGVSKTSYDVIVDIAAAAGVETSYTDSSMDAKKQYYVATAIDMSTNESLISNEVSAVKGIRVDANLVPNPFFELDVNNDGTPDEWTKDSGWTIVEDSFSGNYSMRGRGSGIYLTSDKVSFPISNNRLLLSGVAKSSDTDFDLTEFGTQALTSTPEAKCYATQGIMLITRQDSGYDIIELWDISDSSDVSLLGTISEGSEHRSWPFVMYDDYVVCGRQGTNKIYVYDVSDSSSPSEIDEYTLDSATAEAKSICVRNWTVYVGCDDGADDFIEIIDITVPASPARLYAGNTAGEPSASCEWRHREIKASGHNLIVLKSDGAWVNPAGLPSGTNWSDLSNCVDGNPATGTRRIDTPTETWTEYLTTPIDSTVASGGVRVYTSQSNEFNQAEIDVYDTDASGWVNVYTGVASVFFVQYGVVVFNRNINSIRVKFYNGDAVDVHSAGVSVIQYLVYGDDEDDVYISAYDTTDLTAPVYKCSDNAIGLSNLALNGNYYYCACTGGTNVDKILVFKRATTTSITGPTTVGGAGASTYTGHDALFIDSEYLVNVGVGSTAAKYSVSYWDISTPATPSFVVVGDIDGDMDAAVRSDNLVFGVDVDSSLIRIVNPSNSGDWSFIVNFYNSSDSLLESYIVYVGDEDSPTTWASWIVFSTSLAVEDVPSGTTQVEFSCLCDESVGYVYVDSLEALIDY